MKLNNKGFAISTVMYMILIIAVLMIAITLSLVSSRKLILDNARRETVKNIYNYTNLNYKQVLGILKSEAITYGTNNAVVEEEMKIKDFQTSIDNDTLEFYELLEKNIKIEYDAGTYNIYIDGSLL